MKKTRPCEIARQENRIIIFGEAQAPQNSVYIIIILLRFADVFLAGKKA